MTPSGVMAAALAGAFGCVILLSVDVTWYHCTDAKGLCLVAVATAPGEPALPAFFGLTVAMHTEWLLGCGLVAWFAILDVNAELRYVVRGEPRSGSRQEENAIVRMIIVLVSWGLTLLFGLLLLLSEFHGCVRLPVMWWFAACQLPSTLLVLYLVLSPVCKAIVDNLSMWVELRKLQAVTDKLNDVL